MDVKATKSNIWPLKVDLINIKIYKENWIYGEMEELSQINMLLTKFWKLSENFILVKLFRNNKEKNLQSGESRLKTKTKLRVNI